MYFLGVHSKTPLVALEGDTGWSNTQIRRRTEMLRFWNCVIKMDATRLTRKLFEIEYIICKHTRCLEIKEYFEKVILIFIVTSIMLQ